MNWGGFQYFLDADQMKWLAPAFGARVPKYRRVDWTHFPEFTSIGRLESEKFEPGEWRNDYPNPAFVRMSERDAFWAAKILMRFTSEELRAIVKTGQFEDPAQEEFFFQTLLARQKKSGAYGLNQLNPLDDFSVSGSTLDFVNLSEKYGVGDKGSTYRAQWAIFDNANSTQRAFGPEAASQQTSLQLPSPDLSGLKDPFLIADIRTENASHPTWKKRVSVYLRPKGSTYEVAGIDRESTPSLPPEK